MLCKCVIQQCLYRNSLLLFMIGALLSCTCFCLFGLEFFSRGFCLGLCSSGQTPAQSETISAENEAVETQVIWSMSKQTWLSLVGKAKGKE